MSYLLLLFAAIVFVLGFDKTTTLISALTDANQRRNLLYRLGGFFAMSAWLHLLPLMLMSIYMQHEGILATEIFSEDEPRANLAAIYLTPKVAILVLLLTLPQIVKQLELNWWKIKSWSWLPGLAVAIAFLWPYNWNPDTIAQIVFLFAISLPFVIYLWTAISTPLAKQIERFWMPFLVIFAVTVTMFWWSEETDALVQQQLREFQSGGVPVLVTTAKDTKFMGWLVLLTQKNAYVKTEFTKTLQPCVVRVPLETSYVSTLTNRRSVSSNDVLSPFIQRKSADWARDAQLARENLANVCGALVRTWVLDDMIERLSRKHD